jgi:hypothetical protein
MPGLLNVDLGSDDAGKHYSTDFVLRNRFDGHADSACVLVGNWSYRLDRRIAHEASELRGPHVRIA